MAVPRQRNSSLPPPIRGSWLARQGAGALYNGQLQVSSATKKSDLLIGRERTPPSHKEFTPRAHQSVPKRPHGSACVMTSYRNEVCNESLPRSARKSNVVPTSRDDVNLDTWFAARSLGSGTRPHSATRTSFEATNVEDSWFAFASSRKPPVASNYNSSQRGGSFQAGRWADVGMPFGADFSGGDGDDSHCTRNGLSFGRETKRYDDDRASPERDACRVLMEAELKGRDEVRRVFRQLLLKWHPDKVDEDRRPEATRVFLFLSEQRLRLGLV